MPRTCGICGQEGHNRRTCPELPQNKKGNVDEKITAMKEEIENLHLQRQVLHSKYTKLKKKNTELKKENTKLDEVIETLHRNFRHSLENNYDLEIKLLKLEEGGQGGNEKKHKIVVEQFEVLFNIIDENACNIPDQNYMDAMKALEALYDITK